MATGTIDDPYTLAYLLARNYIDPGDTAILRAGTYTGDWAFSRNGTASKRTTFKAYPGEAVILNGNIGITGDWLRFENIIFAYLDWTTRETLEEGSNPSDLPIKNFSCTGDNYQFINCVTRDLRNVAFYGNGGLVYGHLSYNNGWSAPDRGHGHAGYIQNSTPVKTAENNIFLGGFGYGIHIYTEGGLINNITLRKNTCVDGGILYPANYNEILYGGGQVGQNPILDTNLTYGGGAVNLGYSAGVTSAILTDNYFPDGITKVNASIDTETGNYYGPGIGDVTYLFPYDYETTWDNGRANLTIYNASQADTVQVDVSSAFSVGEVLDVHNVHDYFTDIQQLAVAQDGTITVNMQAANRSIATPVQWTAPAKLFPDFGTFILVKP